MNRRRMEKFCQLAGAACIFTALIFIVLLLPERFTHDIRRSQHINCVNNMKQIGIAFKIWAVDHGGQFPFNVSTNAGGTMEFCAVGKHGFDSNAVLHFQVMSNDDELRSPLLLVCPQDRSRKPAFALGSLRPENVTYRLRSGTNVNDNNPNEILAVCPIHGNFLSCDGSVTEVKKEPEHEIFHYFSDLIHYDEKFQFGLACVSTALAAGIVLLFMGSLFKSKGKGGQA
jgi:hypothetical protein